MKKILFIILPLVSLIYLLTFFFFGEYLLHTQTLQSSVFYDKEVFKIDVMVFRKKEFNDSDVYRLKKLYNLQFKEKKIIVNKFTFQNSYRDNSSMNFIKEYRVIIKKMTPLIADVDDILYVGNNKDGFCQVREIKYIWFFYKWIPLKVKKGIS